MPNLTQLQKTTCIYTVLSVLNYHIGQSCPQLVPRYEIIGRVKNTFTQGPLEEICMIHVDSHLMFWFQEGIMDTITF